MEKDKDIQVFDFDGNEITFKLENGEKFVLSVNLVRNGVGERNFIY